MYCIQLFPCSPQSPFDPQFIAHNRIGQQRCTAQRHFRGRLRIVGSICVLAFFIMLHNLKRAVPGVCFSGSGQVFSKNVMHSDKSTEVSDLNYILFLSTHLGDLGWFNEHNERPQHHEVATGLGHGESRALSKR